MTNPREDIAAIVRSYGFTGEIADMLVDMFTYYVNEHLVKVAGQFYNSSTFKTQNLDAALQLGLDHSVPVSRGSNSFIRLRITATAPVTFAPLQEVFSYGTHFFHVKSPYYIQLDTGMTYDLELVYTTKAKRILEYDVTIPIEQEQSQSDDEIIGKRAFYNDIYIIDDAISISNEVAIYALYTSSDPEDEDVNMILLPYTRHPYQFYLFSYSGSEFHPYLKDLYPILVLTTPRYGINIRINHRYLIQTIKNNMRLRVEYLNYTPAIPEGSALTRLIDHINQNFPVRPENTYISDIISFTSPHSIDTIKYNVAEGTRFNGVIRSVSDFRNWLLSMTDIDIPDARIFYMYSPEYSLNNNNNLSGMNIKYLMIIICESSQAYIISQFIQQHINYIKVLLPTLKMQAVELTDDRPNTVVIYSNSINQAQPTNVYVSEADMILKIATPLTVTIRANYVGNINKNTVVESYKDMLRKYQNRLIDILNPQELFSIFSKIKYVNYVTYFEVYAPINLGQGDDGVYFSLGENNNYVNRPMVLIDKNSIFNDMFNSEAYYIANFELIINPQL